MGKRIVSFATTLAILGPVISCASDKPEDQVRKAFEACRAAVEAGDAAGATAPLAASFQGPEGMDKAATQLFLLGTLRQEKVGVTVVRNDISVRGHDAFQEVDLILTTRSGTLLPQDASHHGFLLRWRKLGGDWKLVEVRNPQSPEGR